MKCTTSFVASLLFAVHPVHTEAVSVLFVLIKPNRVVIFAILYSVTFALTGANFSNKIAK